MNAPAADLERRLAALGQEHVVRVLQRLERADPPAARALQAELAALDLGLLERLRALALGAEEPERPRAFEPPALVPVRRDARAEAHARRARERGEALLRGGGVGYVLVAGGQASRLGLDAPKGTFPVGPVSGRSLFELHARRLLAAQRRWGAPTPWYVMTSPANDAATRAFFAAHGWFGLAPADVFFFAQAMLPALDPEGRMLFAAPGRLFLAPDGHGGVLGGLARSGALADARARGLRELSYFQVDNPLARPADPLFLGLHAEAEAGMSSKVVEKRDAGEKVGVIGKSDGRLGCIEYSDLPAELREAREPDGALRFRAGNIAVHALQVGFVERIVAQDLSLPWHLAHKRVQAWSEDGVRETPATKFETFVFDALARSEASVTLEVVRGEEFSPVKNRSGQDSPATARADQCALYASWVRAAGRALPPPDADGVLPVEIDPLVAESREEFLARRPEASRIDERGHLYE